eukprot:scaffold112811_cov54-Phaeocystis_antarctica.AAC.2
MAAAMGCSLPRSAEPAARSNFSSEHPSGAQSLTAATVSRPSCTSVHAWSCRVGAHRGDARRALEHVAPLDQDAVRRADAATHHDGGGRREAEGARARDDEHRAAEHEGEQLAVVHRHRAHAAAAAVAATVVAVHAAHAAHAAHAVAAAAVGLVGHVAGGCGDGPRTPCDEGEDDDGGHEDGGDAIGEGLDGGLAVLRLVRVRVRVRVRVKGER